MEFALRLLDAMIAAGEKGDHWFHSVLTEAKEFRDKLANFGDSGGFEDDPLVGAFRDIAADADADAGNGA